MPSLANGTCVVLASVYWRRWPSHAFRYIWRTSSEPPSACRIGQSLQFSMASSGPSSPPQRSTHRSQPRSSKYLRKNSRQASELASRTCRSSSAHAGGLMGVVTFRTFSWATPGTETPSLQQAAKPNCNRDMEPPSRVGSSGSGTPTIPNAFPAKSCVGNRDGYWLVENKTSGHVTAVSLGSRRELHVGEELLEPRFTAQAVEHR